MSRLDNNYCNALLCGVSKSLIARLQHVQYDYIHPVLKNLHWLPVESRMAFKTLGSSSSELSSDYLKN